MKGFRFFILIFIFIAAGTWGKGKPVQKKAPDWVLNPQSLYPAGKYLYAVGEGRTRAAAENAALGNLAAIFSQNIKRTTDSFGTLDSKGEKYLSITHSTVSTTNIKDLMGAQVREAYEDGGTWSAVAVIDRGESSDLYRAAIDKANSLVREVTDEEDVEYNLSFLLAVRRSLTLAQKNAVLLDRLAVINSTLAGNLRGGVVTSEEVIKLLDAVSKEVPISIKAADDKIKKEISSVVNDLALEISPDSRYELLAEVLFENRATQDKKSINSSWTLTVTLKYGDDALYTYNKSGRNAGVDEIGAQEKADRAIERVIKGDFLEDFSHYLIMAD